MRGKRTDAERELARLLNSFHEGTSVEPSKITVAEYVRDWLDKADLAAKTIERYRQLAEQQIIPHLGTTTLPEVAAIKCGRVARQTAGKRWQGRQATIGQDRGARSPRLAPRTRPRMQRGNRFARRLYHPSHPRWKSKRFQTLLPDLEIGDLLGKLERNNLSNRPHTMLPLVTLALATGMRRWRIAGPAVGRHRPRRRHAESRAQRREEEQEQRGGAPPEDAQD